MAWAGKLEQDNLTREENIINFRQENNSSPQFLEDKIKKICEYSHDQQDIFPILLFKNIDLITNKNLAEALLPIFDPQQNTELFGGTINLSKFILVATTSTPDIGKISNHLISRLNFINVDTAQPKRFFLDNHYGTFLIISILLSLLLSALIF